MQEFTIKQAKTAQNRRFCPMAGMNRAMSNCTPFMKRQNIYWLCPSVENNDPFAFIMKKCKNDGFSK